MRATPDDIEADPESYDCANCELAQKNDALTLHDRECIEAYGLLAGRAVRFLRLTPMVMDTLGLVVTRQKALETLRKFEAIHRHFGPEDDGDGAAAVHQLAAAMGFRRAGPGDAVE